MIAVCEQARRADLNSTGLSCGHQLGPFSPKPIPLSRFPRPERPDCLRGMSIDEIEQLIADADEADRAAKAEQPVPAYLLGRCLQQDIDASQIDMVRVGAPVSVRIGSENAHFPGSISHVDELARTERGVVSHPIVITLDDMDNIVAPVALASVSVLINAN